MSCVLVKVAVIVVEAVVLQDQYTAAVKVVVGVAVLVAAFIDGAAEAAELFDNIKIKNDINIVIGIHDPLSMYCMGKRLSIRKIKAFVVCSNDKNDLCLR